MIQKIRDEGEDLGRDLVDRRESVSQVPNEAENFESVSFENVDLEYATHQPQSTLSFRLFI